MVESINKQSSAEIMNILSQAENRGKSVRVNDQGQVVIANFGNKIAEALRGFGKSAEWKAQRQVDIAEKVVEVYSDALQSDAVHRVTNTREWKIFSTTMYNLFQSSGDVLRDASEGHVTSAGRLKELLQNAESDAISSHERRFIGSIKVTLRELKDGSLLTKAQGLKDLNQQKLAGAIRGFNGRLEDLREHFAAEQKKYADEPNPTDEQAASLRDLANAVVQLEDLIETTVNKWRDGADPERFVADHVTVPDRAYDRENFSLRGEVRRAIDDQLTAINDLQGKTATSPALKKLDAFLDRFLTKANEIGEIVDTDGLGQISRLALNADNGLEDIDAIIQDDNDDLSAADQALLQKARDLINDLVDTLMDDRAVQQVRFGGKDDLDIGEAADAPGYRVELGPEGFRSKASTRDADSKQNNQYSDAVTSRSEYYSKSNDRHLGSADKRITHNNEKWNAALEAEPKADRKEFKPSDERFVRGDVSELEGVDDSGPANEIIVNDDPQPAKSNLRKR